VKLLNWLVLAIVGLAAVLVAVLSGSPPPGEVVGPPEPTTNGVENQAPVILGRPGWPILSSASTSWKAIVIYDARQRGDCSAACDEVCLLISDPEDDPLLFRWEFHGPSATSDEPSQYRVYSAAGEEITDDWTETRVVQVIIGGLVDDPPPYVLKRCRPDPEPPPVPEDPAQPFMYGKLSVWDQVNDPVDVRWHQPVGTPTCE